MILTWGLRYPKKKGLTEKGKERFEIEDRGIFALRSALILRFQKNSMQSPPADFW